MDGSEASALARLEREERHVERRLAQINADLAVAREELELKTRTSRLTDLQIQQNQCRLLEARHRNHRLREQLSEAVVSVQQLDADYRRQILDADLEWQTIGRKCLTSMATARDKWRKLYDRWTQEECRLKTEICHLRDELRERQRIDRNVDDVSEDILRLRRLKAEMEAALHEAAIEGRKRREARDRVLVEIKCQNSRNEALLKRLRHQLMQKRREYYGQ